MSTHLHTIANKYLKSLESRGLSEHHIRATRCRVKKIVSAFPANPVESIKLEDLEDFLHRSGGSPKTKHHVATVLKGIFQWAQDHNYIPEDRRHAASRLKAPKVRPVEPGIFTPQEMQRMLRCATELDPSLIWVMHYLILGGFVGIRTAEIERLQWSDILLDHGCVRMSHRITKTGARRVAYIPENGVAWLRLAPGKGSVLPNVGHQNLQRYALMAAKPAGVTWKHNGLRHSYVSYAMARARNAWEVAEQVGNTPKILQASYKGLVLPAEAEEWFNITPDNTL